MKGNLMPDLKCFRVDNSGESCWCITDTPEKALAIAHENAFETDETDEESVVEEPGEKMLAIYDEDQGESYQQTIRAWIDDYGEGTGFLCTTNF
jgi:hypothetical protein